MGPALRLCALLFLAMSFPALSPAETPEPPPEEPDFFFLTGGPYTQKKNSPQIIWANQWVFSRSGPRRARDSTGAGRFEWGLTDNLEADFEFGALAVRERLLGTTVFSESGPDDLLFGVRYRLLNERSAPFTLTIGPQLIAPVASRRRGLGAGRTGYAWDTTAAKDWGGPVFLVASLNLSVTPDVPALPDGTGPRLDLAAVTGATALGWRALERPRADGANHDLHVLFEFGGAREDEIASGARARSTPVLFSPGLRYGFLTRAGALAEMGVAFPVGLNRDAPDWGFILQVQYEWPSLF